ncbi:MAG: PAS domain S-box protein [Thermodesulfobacteriota bacterium]
MDSQTNLALSDEDFRRLAENLKAILWIISLNGEQFEVVYSNPAYEQVWGRPIQSLLEDPGSWLDAVHPEDRPRLADLPERFLRGDFPEEEYRIIRPDGEVRWIHTQTFPVRTETGEGPRVCGLSRDITPRRQTEEAWKSREETLRLLYEGIPLGYQSLDAEGRLLEVNQTWLDTLGYAREEVINRNIREFLAPEHVPLFNEKFSLFTVAGELNDLELDMVRKDGSCITVFYNGKIDYDSQGRFRRSHCILSNITERRRAEAELFREKEKYRLLAEKSPLGVAIIGADGTYKYINSKFTELFGYRLEDVPTGKIWFAKAFPDAKYRQQSIAIWKKDLEGGKVGEGLARTFTVTCKDGSEKIITFRPVTLETGEQLVIYQDITEAQRAEEALRQSEQKYRRLVSNMPAVVFKGYADWSVDLFDNKIKGFTGYPKEAFNSRKLKWSDVILKEDLAGARRTFLQALKTKKPYVRQYRIRDKRGKIIWVEERGQIIFDREGKFDYISGVSFDITKQKVMAEALRQSEEKYRLLVNQIPAIIYKGYADWSIEFFDKKIESLTGYRKKDFDSGKIKWCDLVLLEDMDQAQKTFVKALKTTKDYVREYRIRRKDGEILWIQCQGKIFLDAQGKVDYVSGVFFDITNRQRAEEALQKYDFIANATKEYMTLIDRNYVYEAANEAYCQAHGRTRDEVVGSKVSDIWGKSTFKNIIKGYLDQCFTGQAVEYEGWFEFGRQGLGCYKVSYSPYYQDDGTVAYAAVVTHNITKRKQAEEALAAEKERLAVTLRSIGDGVVATDTVGKIVLMNPVAERLTGWLQPDALGKPVSEVLHLIHEKTGRRLENPAETVSRTGQTVSATHDTILLAKDGSQHLLAYSGAPIVDQHNNIIGVVLVFQDITRKRQTEAELLKVEKLSSLGILAGGIAHDFNNIFTGILGNISLAMLSCRDDESIQRNLAEAEKATLRATDLAQQLLTFAKGGEPIKEVASLGDIIKESASFACRGSHVRCKFAFPEDLWPVEVDAGQISQVIQNLIINSIQAMPTGGTVSIATENMNLTSQSALPLQPGRYVKISVRDRGLGIPTEHLANIFDPYFTTKQKGSGLGLAIVYSIIKRHGGHITVDSRLGAGTTCYIYLPASQKKVEPKRKSAMELVTGKGKILVMDDEEIVRGVAGKILTLLGYEVEFAGDGAKAVEMYQQALDSGRPFDAVVMDLTVPGGMGGEEAMRRLLEIDPRAKGIVSSGYADDTIVTNFKEFGFSGVIKKPYRVEDFSRVFQEIFK